MTVFSSVMTNVEPVKIANMPGNELPETGGMGTGIFVMTGSLLTMAAAVLLITKKRMGENH